MDWQSVLNHSLITGLVLSLPFGLVVLGSMRINPEIWLGDFPKDIQAAYGQPRNPRTAGQKAIVSLVFFTMLIGGLALSVSALHPAGGWGWFGAVASHLFIATSIVNLFDLLVLDLLLILAQPAWMILPGTEGMASYRDFTFHIIAFAKGTLMMLVVAFIGSGITQGIIALL